ncbi:MarR family transcriptional regulator [Altererythrobacter fulvus]|uniref:MarR family winged helix-turn-helix transcriptional regulator n=1 Tax=Caenibius fulvus TaxID=2126012 RepID=UPI0030189C88
MNLPATWHLFGAEHTPFQLLLLAKMIDRVSARQLVSTYGISLAEWRVLAFVCSAGPSSASEIGAAGEIDRAEISRAVNKLLEGGLITREPSEDNRRRLIISPTTAGEAQYRKIRDERRAYFQSIMAVIPDEERGRFAQHLQALAEAVGSLR